MSDFVIHLPSNVQPTRFPSNSAASFSTQLDCPIELDGAWDVAVAEVTYPKSVKMFQDEGIKCVQSEHEVYWKVSSPYENTIEALILTLNEKSVNYMYHFAERHGTLTLEIESENMELILDKSLSELLGFHITCFSEKKTYHAYRPPALYRNIDYVFIYSNISDYVNVGHMSAPLLHAVPFMKDGYGPLIHHSIHIPMYRSIKTSTLDRIDLRLCDSNGNDIPFGDINIYLQFHFHIQSTLNCGLVDDMP